VLRHVEDSSLGMCTHAAHAVGGGGDRRKSCATESRSTTCMIPPQRGHFHSGRFEGVPDEAVTAAGLSESWLLEQLETQGKELRSPAVRQEAEVTDAHKPKRQQMEQKAAQEFLNRKAHAPLAVAVGRVSPPERDLAIGERNQSVVGDSNAVGIGAEVAENAFRAAKRRLAVDHPILAEQYA